MVMKKRTFPWVILLTICVAVFVLIGVTNLQQGQQAEDQRQLEQVLHRTAVACYAVEGVYPPDVAYMREHYGLTYDESRYAVHYELIASNIMPVIDVMVRNHEK